MRHRGLFSFDLPMNSNYINIAKTIKPSKRGELEITEVNNIFMNKYGLKISLLGRGFTWLDTGTPDALMEAANFVQTVQKRQGLSISCSEEIAYKKGFINREQLEKLGNELSKTSYGQYLLEIANGL